MALTLIVIALLLLALGFVQGWLYWYLKREIARVDQRLDESLDDQDLLDFQERLQALMLQAREAGVDMVQTVDKRQTALEKSLQLVREAEKQLVARAQLLELTAQAIGKRAEDLKAGTGDAKAKKPVAKPKPGPAAKAPKPTEAEEEQRRSYLSRPAAPAPQPVAAPQPVTAISKHQRIYDLADQGLNRDQIAKESGVLPGEVELILNLRPKRKDR